MTLIHELKDYPSLISIVAQEIGVSEVIVEKDYWVTYILHALAQSEFKDRFIFKGGTSLSKSWDLIKRFSEDIDLLLIDTNLSGTAQVKLTEKIRDFISTLPGLKYDLDNVRNASHGKFRHSCFVYEQKTKGAVPGVESYILVEMGYRGGIEPSEDRPVQSYLGKKLTESKQGNVASNTGEVSVKTLHPKRTFVEKLFAIHDNYERGPIPGKERHYYDVYYLLGMSEVKNFLGSQEYKHLKSDIAQLTQKNFKDSRLPPNNDFAQSNALSPMGSKLDALQASYGATFSIYYGDRPEFQEILARIGSFKNKF